MAQRLLTMAAGGTGGHMFPAQALAEAMLAQGWRVKLSTDERGGRYTSGFPDAVEIEELPSATFARGGLIARAQVPFRIASGVVEATLRMRRDRPDVVIGFGGYPSIPALSAATLLKRPRLIHEQNGVLGRVNTYFARRVDSVACGTWPTELPEGANGVAIGNPVRQAILDMAGAPYTPPSADGPIRLLVIGGSQGARILSDVVPQALASLPRPLRDRLTVDQQAREEDLTRVTTVYRHAEMERQVDVMPFFRDVPERMAAAQLVISRAGASSVADLTVIGRPAILVPFAAATGDHQTANARPMEQADAAIVLSEADLTPERLAAEIAVLLQQPDRAAHMADGARRLGRTDATERLVDLIHQLAQKEAGA